MCNAANTLCIVAGLYELKPAIALLQFENLPATSLLQFENLLLLPFDNLPVLQLCVHFGILSQQIK
jgi:hypothetical protein